MALTRAKYGLKIIAKTPPKKVKDPVDNGQDVEWKDLSQLLYGFVRSMEYHAGTMYDFSSLERKAGLAEPVEALWPSFPAGNRGRLKFSRDAADFFGPDGLVGPQASNRLRGLVLHDILASVKLTGDLPGAVDRAVASGALPADDREPTLSFLSGRLSDAASRGWFDADGVEILNEASLIGTDGREHRPDRVILHAGGNVTVVDYKFGRPESEHRDQVAGYMDLYRRMGYKEVGGFLWYVESGEVVSV